MTKFYIKDGASEEPMRNCLLVFRRNLRPRRHDPRLLSKIFVRVGRSSDRCVVFVLGDRGFVEVEDNRIRTLDHDEVLVCDYVGRILGRVSLLRDHQNNPVNRTAFDLVIWIPHNLATGFATCGWYPGVSSSSTSVPDGGLNPVENHLPTLPSRWFPASDSPPSLGSAASPLSRTLPFLSFSFTPENSVRILADNVSAWGELERSIQASTTRCLLVSLSVKPETSLSAAGRGSNPPRTLATMLREASRRNSNYELKVLTYAQPRDARELHAEWNAAFSGGSGQALISSRVLFRQIHNKFCIVDNTVFVIGSPMDSFHVEDRGHAVPTPSWHDVSVAIDGGSILGEFLRRFYTLWVNAAGHSHESVNLPPDIQAQSFEECSSSLRPIESLMPDAPAASHSATEETTSVDGRIAIQLNITSNFCSYRRRTVAESYARAFLKAERYIYIENQYFYAPSIVAALARALELKRNLQLVVLTNPVTDLPWSRETTSLMARLLRSSNRGHRANIYCLWRAVRDDLGFISLMSVYVHSKVAIVDDVWCSIGSANLNQISLEGVSSYSDDIDAVTDAAEESNIALWRRTPGGKPAELRNALWSEYGVQQAGAPDAPALDKWNGRCDWAIRALRSRNAGPLNDELPTGSPSVVCFPLPLPRNLVDLTSPEAYVRSAIGGPLPGNVRLRDSRNDPRHANQFPSDGRRQLLFSLLSPREVYIRNFLQGLSATNPEEDEARDHFFILSRDGSALRTPTR